MIAKGNLHNSGPALISYMMKGEEHEKAELIDLRGVADTDPRKAFKAIQAVAEGLTHIQKPFLHGQFRLAPDEALTNEQWLDVADRMEKALGLEGQARAVTLHSLEDGSRHMHVAWSRVDMDTMRGIDPGLYLRKMQGEAREIEKEFGLRELTTGRDPHEPAPARRAEFEEARRLGVDLKDTRQAIREAYEQSDNGKAFIAALEDKGFILAQGDRRDFVVVDREGGQHALGKRICNETAEAVRQKFSDIDKAALPTVKQAKGLAQEAERARPGIDGPEIESAATTQPEAAKTLSPKETQQLAEEKERQAEQIERAEAGNNPGSAALRVVDGVAGVAMGVADFAFGLLAGGGGAKKPATPLEQMRQNQRARAAYEQIKESMDKGEGLRPEDLQSLPEQHLKSIAARGDDYIRQIIEMMERDRQRQRENGQER